MNKEVETGGHIEGLRLYPKPQGTLGRFCKGSDQVTLLHPRKVTEYKWSRGCKVPCFWGQAGDEETP